jgi:hypothetical protein
MTAISITRPTTDSTRGRRSGAAPRTGTVTWRQRWADDRRRRRYLVEQRRWANRDRSDRYLDGPDGTYHRQVLTAFAQR